MYCWDAQFTQEQTEAQRDQETCPKSSIVDELFTSMSGPAKSVYLVCLTPKPTLFSPVPYTPNTHSGRCLFRKTIWFTQRLQMILLLGFFIQILIYRAAE